MLKLCPAIVYGNKSCCCSCFFVSVSFTLYENLKGIIESVVDNGGDASNLGDNSC